MFSLFIPICKHTVVSDVMTSTEKPEAGNTTTTEMNSVTNATSAEQAHMPTGTSVGLVTGILVVVSVVLVCVIAVTVCLFAVIVKKRKTALRSLQLDVLAR